MRRAVGQSDQAAPSHLREWRPMKLSGRGLSCVRGGRRVFCGIAFSVAAGQALVLTGPNGAGKSSLLRVIAGLIKPAAGTVVLKGGDGDLSVGEQSHYLGHLDPLKPALTVTENLKFWASFLNDGSGTGNTGQALETAGLADLAHLPAGYLSAGQRRRLSLARVLAVPRPIWLFDEPTTALDAASQARLQTVMQAHLTGGGIIIAATHGPLGLAASQELQLGGSGGCDLDTADALNVWQ
jgi:heme exporter protein A